MFKKIANAVKPDATHIESEVDTKPEGAETPSVEQAPVRDQSSHTGAPEAGENNSFPIGGPSNESNRHSETGKTAGPPSSIPSAKAPPTGLSEVAEASSDLVSGERNDAEPSNDGPSNQTSNIATESGEVHDAGITKAVETAQQANGTGGARSEDSFLVEKSSSQADSEETKADAGIQDAEDRLKFA